MYANRYGYTDVEPHEIIKQNTLRKMTIRTMNSDLDLNWVPEVHPGGFCANISNQNKQKWIITPRENGAVYTIRLHKDGIWKDSYGNKYNISEYPVRFYDYNF